VKDRDADKVGRGVSQPVVDLWPERFLTVARFRELIPEAAEREVRRYELPDLRVLNVVVVRLLGEGVAASTRPDPQAKSLGERLRAKIVELPEAQL